MEERKIGLVPKVQGQSMGGVREYGLLVTDKRSIFVMELKDSTGLGYSIGGIIGAAIAASARTRRTFDYDTANPDVLGGMPDNVVIHHDAIESLRFKFGALGNFIQFKFRTADGKTRKFQVSLFPKKEYFLERKNMGKGRREAIGEYANEVQTLYRRALPLATTTKVVWSE